MLKRLSLVLVPSALILGAFLLILQIASSPPAALAAGSADVKVVSQTLGTPNGSNQCVNPAPTTFPINTPTVVCTRLTFHNNGPLNPADVSISRSASFVPALGQGASECTITPTGGLLTFNNVPTSVTMTRDENYTVSCTKPSSHKFRFTNTLSPGPAGTTDPDTSNNSATSDLDVGVTAVVDFDITSQVLKDSDCTSPPPTSILVNTNAVFCIVKTIHNNGPYGPSTADIFFRSDPPTDCTLIPFVDTNGAIIDVSVTYTHTELFTLNCSQPSNHSFLIENFVNPTDPHTTDPDGTDYYATSHTVAVIGQTDVKVQSQSASGPASGQPGVPFTVTVDKTLHNNGPFGPAQVSISATASAPADCTVTPGANPTAATLAISVASPRPRPSRSRAPTPRTT